MTHVIELPIGGVFTTPWCWHGKQHSFDGEVPKILQCDGALTYRAGQNLLTRHEALRLREAKEA